MRNISILTLLKLSQKRRYLIKKKRLLDIDYIRLLYEHNAISSLSLNTVRQILTSHDISDQLNINSPKSKH